MSTTLVTKVHPFWGRVSVIESPVDETQQPSGLILPWAADEKHLLRGVVTGNDPTYDSDDSYRYSDVLKPGVIVWYTHGVRVRDVVIVNASDIYAFETEEAPDGR